MRALTQDEIDYLLWRGPFKGIVDSCGSRLEHSVKKKIIRTQKSLTNLGILKVDVPGFRVPGYLGKWEWYRAQYTTTKKGDRVSIELRKAYQFKDAVEELKREVEAIRQ
jgi:hypothetical protein